MKSRASVLLCVAILGTQALRADLVIPSDGSDGALIVTNNLVIDLSNAVTTNWNANNSLHAGGGRV